MKYLKTFETHLSSNTNTNGLFKVYLEEAYAEMIEHFYQKIKKCFEEEYSFTFELEPEDVTVLGSRYRPCLVNGIPMRIKEFGGSFNNSKYEVGGAVIKFNIEGLVKAKMTEVIEAVTDGKKTSGPEFESVLEVVVYFQKHSISAKANKNLKPLIKTGLLD